jgi:hypothetical protein
MAEDLVTALNHRLKRTLKVPVGYLPANDSRAVQVIAAEPSKSTDATEAATE